MAIYCMSGTGNSYFVAKRLAADLGLTLINPFRLKAQISDDDSIVGFVFPIYDFKASEAFFRQMKKLHINNENAYAFAFATYGIGTLKAYKHFLTEMQKLGKKVDAGFAVQLPHNAVGSLKLSDSDINEVLAKGYQDIEKAITGIKEKRKGDFMTTTYFALLRNKFTYRMISSVFLLLKQLIINGKDSLRFTADNHCKHCGTCESICPVDNIKLVKGYPQFGNDCVSCFACIQWCPTSAISFSGKRLDLRQYTHPSIELREMINFNNDKF